MLVAGAIRTPVASNGGAAHTAARTKRRTQRGAFRKKPSARNALLCVSVLVLVSVSSVAINSGVSCCLASLSLCFFLTAQCALSVFLSHSAVRSSHSAVRSSHSAVRALCVSLSQRSARSLCFPLTVAVVSLPLSSSPALSLPLSSSLLSSPLLSLLSPTPLSSPLSPLSPPLSSPQRTTTTSGSPPNPARGEHHCSFQHNPRPPWYAAAPRPSLWLVARGLRARSPSPATVAPVPLRRRASPAAHAPRAPDARWMWMRCGRGWFWRQEAEDGVGG